VTDGIIEPVIVSILAHLQHDSLRLHVLDQVTDQLRILGNRLLLLFAQLDLPGQLGVVDTYRVDLLFEVFQLHHMVPVFLDVLIFHLLELELPFLLLDEGVPIEGVASIANQSGHPREVD
jgi:hypothetical protein